jgi:hypothetical protein
VSQVVVHAFDQLLELDYFGGNSVRVHIRGIVAGLSIFILMELTV